MIIAIQLIMIALVLTKITFLAEGGRINSLLHALSLGHQGQAIAQTMTTGSPVSPRDITDDGLHKERDLLLLLQKKQKELDLRESAIKAEEEKITALKKEILEKIEVLKALDAQLATKLDHEKSNDTKRLKDLAKVYEAAPPQKAATMLEKLDTKTAAGITINMKRERAGLIWGYLNPQKGVEITNEIARIVKAQPE